MAAVGRDQQAVANAEVANLGLIGEVQLGTAAQHHQPFEFPLVVPEPLRAAGQAGVNALQPPARAAASAAPPSAAMCWSRP